MKHSSHIEEPLINLTPLLDVVFVVLIMFIVVAPLLDVDHIELATKGNMDSSSLSDKSPISIHVYADNSLRYNGERVAAPNLAKVLRAAKASYPHAKPQVFHDKRASFGTYQTVKNALETAGYREMDIVLAPGS